jgi:hypothetical protein
LPGSTGYTAAANVSGEKVLDESSLGIHHVRARGVCASWKGVMPTRREFLQVGFAASVFPIATPIDVPSLMVERNDMAAGNRRSLYCVVADVRFADAVAFGLLAEHLGYEVVRVAGDITDFWFNNLSLRWKEEAVAIAGVTAHGPLFCLERFAWDHGLRVVFRSTSPAADVLHTNNSPERSEAVARSAVDDAGEALVSWVIAPRSENG